MTKLNLGCGNEPLKDFINIDKYKYYDDDECKFMECDLEKFPLPFANDSIDYIYSYHCLEHLLYLEDLVKELFRICKDGAILEIIVPHFTKNTCELHIRPFRYGSFYQYNIDNKTGQDYKYFKDIERKLIFKGFYSIMNIININPFLCHLYEDSPLRSFFFCKEIKIKMKVIKDAT